jgi:hypothetical protein
MNSATSGVLGLYRIAVGLLRFVFVKADEAVEISLGLHEIFDAVLLTPARDVLDDVTFAEADVSVQAEGDDIPMAAVRIVKEVTLFTSSGFFRGDGSNITAFLPFREITFFGMIANITRLIVFALAQMFTTKARLHS